MRVAVARPGFIDRLATAGVAGIAVLAAALIGLRMQPPGVNVAVFWPAAGVVAGVVLLTEGWHRAAAVAGSLVALTIGNTLEQRGIATSAVFMAGNIGQALVLAALLRGVHHHPLQFDRLAPVVAFIGGTIAVVAGAAVLTATGLIATGHATAPWFAVWQTWFLSHAIGILTVAPAVLALGRDHAVLRGERREDAALLVMLAVSAFLVIGVLTGHTLLNGIAALCVLYPLSLWLAARAAPPFSACGLFAVAAAVVWHTTLDQGLFAGEPMAAQVFLLAVAFSVLTLAAVFARIRADAAALRTGQDRLDFVLRGARAGIWDRDLKHDTAQWSDQAYELYGRPRRENGGSLNDWLALVDPEDRQRVASELDAAWAKRVPEQTLQFRIQNPEKGLRWLETLSRIAYDQTGRPTRHAGIVIDITARKNAEQALREQQTRLNLTLAAVGAGVWERDTIRDCAYWSPEMFTIYGRDPAAGAPSRAALMDLIHPEDRARTASEISAAYTKGGPFRIEFRVRRPADGTEVWIASEGIVEDGATARGIDRDVSAVKREAETARTNEERLRLATEGAGVGVWDADLSSGAIVWSPSLFRLCGLPPHPAGLIRIEQWRALLHAEDAEAIAAGRDAASRIPGETRFEYRIVRPDTGEVAWLSTLGRTIPGPDGKPARFVGVAMDITARKQAEEEERKLVQLAEYSTDFVGIADLDGRLQYINRAGRRMVGLDDDADLRDVHFTDYIAPPYLSLFRSTVIPTARANGLWEGEMQLVNLRTGGVVDVHRTTFALRDEAGNITGYGTVTRDITRRKQTEAALRDSEERLRTLANAAPGVMWTADPDGTITFASETWFRYTGLDPQENARNWADHVLHPDDRARCTAQWELALRTGEPYEVEVRNRRHDGVYRWCLTRARPARDAANRVTGWYGFTVDIDDLKQAQAALAENESRFRSIFAQYSGFFQILAPDGTIQDSNDRALAGAGTERAAMIGHKIWEAPLFARDRQAAAEVRADIEAAQHGHVARRESASYISPAGERRFFDRSVYPVYGADGAVTAIVIEGRNVSDRVGAEQALRTERDRLSFVLDAARAGTWDIDLGTGAVTCSDRFRELFFAGPDTDLSHRQDLLSRLHPADRPGQQRAIRRALADRAEYRAEYRVLGKDGAVRWILAVGHGSYNAAGTPERVSGIVIDISDRKEAEAAVAVAERTARSRLDELETIYRTAPIGLTVLTPDLRFLRINEKLAEINGIPAADHIGQTVRGLLPGIADAAGTLARRVVETGEPVLDVEISGETAARPGVKRTWIESWIPVKASDGAVVAINVVAEEVTEKLAAQAALAASEARFRRIAETIGDIFWIVDPASQATLYLSPAYEKLTGRSAESGMRAPGAWLEAVHPDDRARVAAAFAALMETGTFHIEYRVLHVDGTVRWIRDRGYRVVDADGVLSQLVGSGEDITEQRAARDLQERFRAVVASANEGVWVVDQGGGTVFANEQMATLLGTDPDVLARGGVMDFVFPREVEQARDHIAANFAGRSEQFESRFRLADGTAVPVLAATSPLRDGSGAIAGALGMFSDLTERKAAEAALRDLNAHLEERVREEVAAREAAQVRAAHAERMQALGQLAGGIAHDLNNVLQAVSSGAALIERSSGDPSRVLRLTGVIGDAARRGGAITSRLLSFSRLADLRTEPLDPHGLLENVCEVLGHSLGPGIRCVIDAADDLPMVQADRGQLETVLVNLATNARDAMPDGGTITLSARAETFAAPAHGLAPGAYVRLAVADTGSGIAADILSRVTEPFFTTKPQGKGTGLGLPMAKGFAEQSGGALVIESEPGRGTVVLLWLPVSTNQSKPPAEAPAAAFAERAARVLLVDDDAMVREPLAAELEEAGFGVLVAESGIEAISLLEAGEPVDVLVSDHAMPGMNGLAVIREAQSRRPDLPAILLTGYAGDTVALAASAPGANFTLVRKPVPAQALAARIAVMLEGRARVGL